MTSIRCSTRVRLWCALAVMGVWLVMAARDAHAQGTAIAEGLFRDGKKLLDQKKFAEACPKFEESARLEASSGVSLALGLCYEGLGKTASAWGAYQDAVKLARRDNRKDRERAATLKVNALEPKLVHASIDVPADVAGLAGLVVKEDNVAIGAAAWKSSPIDPGTHTLEVSATGKKPWSTSFTIEDSTATKTIAVPKLEDAPQPVDQGGERVVVERSNPFRTVSYITLSAGLATLVAASILGAVAISDATDARKTCPTATCTDARAVSENNTAGSIADWSTGLFVASGVCLVATAVFFFMKPHEASSHGIALHPLLGPRALGFGGVF